VRILVAGCRLGFLREMAGADWRLGRLGRGQPHHNITLVRHVDERLMSIDGKNNGILKVIA
jgi:hypothetical protein